MRRSRNLPLNVEACTLLSTWPIDFEYVPSEFVCVPSAVTVVVYWPGAITAEIAATERRFCNCFFAWRALGQEG